MEKRSKTIKILVQNTQLTGANARADKFLSCEESLVGAGVTRSGLGKLFDQNKVTVNGVAIKKSLKVKNGQEIIIELPEEKEVNTNGPVGTDIPLNIIYEDDHLAVLNKQYGIAVHPGEGEENDYTLVSALIFHFGSNLSTGEDKDRPGIVHRLDKDTTGLIVICKTDEAHKLMKQKFAERTDDVIKVYHTIVVGNFNNDHDIVRNYIMRHPKLRHKMTTTNDEKQGKESLTEYQVLKRYKIKNQFYNLLKITLHTGRTHQIRVTMSSLAHPVVGDPLYHKKNAKHKVEKLCLVSKELQFNHPIPNQQTSDETKPLSFVIPYPQHMQEFIDYLESKNEGVGDGMMDDDFDINM